MEAKNRIGILGGTFDPVHNGHLALAEAAYKYAALESIWFLPNYIPPHKSTAFSNEKAKERLDMLKLAIGGRNWCQICAIELERKGRSYTYMTIEELNRRYPETDFAFIIGADSLFELDHWREPRRILSGCALLVAKRPDARIDGFEEQIQYLSDNYGARIEVIPMELNPISSVEIRSRIAQGLNIEDEVPRAVSAYIRDKRLYQYGE